MSSVMKNPFAPTVHEDDPLAPVDTKLLTEDDIKKEPIDQVDTTSYEFIPPLPIKEEVKEEEPEINDTFKMVNINEILVKNCYVKLEKFDDNKNKVVKQKSIQKSDAKLTKDTLYCKICKNHISKNLYEDHMVEHGLKKYQKCEICGRIFRKPCELAKHLNDVHKCKKTFECQMCRKKFHLLIQLDFHLKLHFKTKHICTYCCKEFSRSSKLLRHQKIHEEREQAFCFPCDRLFVSEDSFKMHVKLYHSAESAGKIKNKCPVCGKEVVNVKRHTLIMHKNAKTFQCDQCEKSYICNSALRKHLEEKHLGIRKERALCYICGKTFPCQSDLKKHLPKHDENRDYRCNLCNKKYKTPKGLATHLKVHKGIRTFSCSPKKMQRIYKRHASKDVVSLLNS